MRHEIFVDVLPHVEQNSEDADTATATERMGFSLLGSSSFGRRRFQRLALVLATKFNSNSSFNLTKDHLIGDATSSFVISDNIRFFIDFLKITTFEQHMQELIVLYTYETYSSQILLGESFILTSFLDQFANF